MGNVSNRFLLMFFNAFLMIIVFINYIGWSGAYINLATGSQFDWTNSYFGFQSIELMIRVLNQMIESVEKLRPNYFIRYAQEVLDDITFNIPYFLSKVAEKQGFDLLGFIRVIAELLFQPLLLTLHLLLMLGCILWYALNFISIIFLAFSGQFNIPFDNALDWQQVQEGYDSANRLLISVRAMI